MTIRPLREDDHAFVLALAARLTDVPLSPWRDRNTVRASLLDTLADQLARRPGNSHLFVAEVQREPAGFIHLQLGSDMFGAGPSCHVSDLVVAPRCEGRGIASALLHFGEQFALSHGCSVVTLAVFPGNERARALYLRTGFQPDVLRMAKPLRP